MGFCAKITVNIIPVVDYTLNILSLEKYFKSDQIDDLVSNEERPKETVKRFIHLNFVAFHFNVILSTFATP